MSVRCMLRQECMGSSSSDPALALLALADRGAQFLALASTPLAPRQ
jgi:hypothetical protein